MAAQCLNDDWRECDTVGEDVEKDAQAGCRCFKIMLLFVKPKSLLPLSLVFSFGKPKDSLCRLKASMTLRSHCYSWLSQLGNNESPLTQGIIMQ